MRFHIRRIETTTSTNDDAKNVAASGGAEGVVFWALRQTAGRGRQGRSWESPPGNLYFSVLLRPPVSSQKWGCYSFVVGLAVAEVVRALLPEASIELKWPNDVLIDGKKISGILLEGGEGWLVVGVGLNVLHVPDAPIYPVTSLVAEGEDIPASEEILDRLLGRLDAWYERMNAEGFAPIRSAWLSLARKGVLRVRLPRGGGEIQGEFLDLDPDGALRLRLEDGAERRISAGDIL